MDLEMKTLGELLRDPSLPAVMKAGECGYRRGYCHGYANAMDDILSSFHKALPEMPEDVGRAFNAAWNRMAHFFDGPLCDWRCEASGGESVPPQFLEAFK